MIMKIKAVLISTVLLIAQFSLTACSSGPDKPVDLDYFKNEVAGKTWLTSQKDVDYRIVWEPTSKPNVYITNIYIGDLKTKAGKQDLYRVEVYDKAKHDKKNRKDDHPYDYELIHIKKGYTFDIIVKGDEIDEYKNGRKTEYELEE